MVLPINEEVVQEQVDYIVVVFTFPSYYIHYYIIQLTLHCILSQALDDHSPHL